MLLNDFFFWVSGYHVCDMYQYDIVKLIIWIANKLPWHVLSSFHRHCYVWASFHQLEFSSFLDHQLSWNGLLQQAPNPIDGFVHSHSRNLTTSNHVMCASSRNTNIPPRPNPQPPIMYKYRIDWKGQIRHLVCALICKEFGDEFDPLNPWEDRRLGWDDIISIHSPHGWSFPKSGRGDHHPIHSRGGRSVKQNFRVFCVKKNTFWSGMRSLLTCFHLILISKKRFGSWHWRLVSSKFACLPEGSWQLGYRFEVRGVLDTLTVWVLERLQLKPATRHNDEKLNVCFVYPCLVN